MKTEILRPNELLYLLDIFLQALGSTTSFVLIKEPFQNQAFIHSRNMTDPPVGEFPYEKDWDVHRKFYRLKQPRSDFVLLFRLKRCQSRRKSSQLIKKNKATP